MEKCAERTGSVSVCGLVGAVGIEIASLLYKDLHGNDLALPPLFNCCQMLLELAVAGQITG
jgi:hypothetical protein